MSVHRFRFSFTVAVLILAVGLPAPASAQGSTKEVKIAGMGLRKCSEWQQWKETRNGEGRAMVLEWTQGFIAGHNVYSRARAGGNSVVADAKVLLPLIDSFCEKNPDSRILSVVIQITHSLGGENVQLHPEAPAQALPQRVPPASDKSNAL
jgi:hypothetical protein